MTGEEIIDLARLHFGEPVANTVTTDDELDYLNEATLEIYEALPPDRLKNLLTKISLTLTNDKGDVDPTWDKIIEVYVDGTPAIRVNGEVINNASYGTMFEPPIPIYAVDEKHLWVKPTGTVEVVISTPPTPVVTADLPNEFTKLDSLWHPAIANLMAAYMYAQEEDQAQASYYRSLYQGKMSTIVEQAVAEEG